MLGTKVKGAEKENILEAHRRAGALGWDSHRHCLYEMGLKLAVKVKWAETPETPCGALLGYGGCYTWEEMVAPRNCVDFTVDYLLVELGRGRWPLWWGWES